MLLEKRKKNLRVAIFLPCYKRPEYTQKCKEALIKHKTFNEVIYSTNLPSLRDSIIEFFDFVKIQEDFDIICKVDNDCIVPENWLRDALEIFDSSDVEILSPNVMPSNAAFMYGRDAGLPYMPSKIVGGLWMMRASLIRDMIFDKYPVTGLVGAISILKQIINEKNPVVGWASKIIVQDLGHWSGQHPEHIKSKEHENYSYEVGRDIAWSSSRG